MAFERLTSLSKTTDTTIKQGDTSSRIGFRLSSRDGQVFNGPAQLQLVNGQGQVHEQMVDVLDNHFDFKLDAVLPADTYTVEVEIDGYVFPSAKDRTITIRQNLGEDSLEVQELKRLSVKEEVDKYLQAHEAGQVDLDVLIERLKDRLPEGYDDSPLKAQISQISTQIETLNQSGRQSSQYDDSELREALRSLSERLEKLSNYDDADLRRLISERVYDDTAINQRVSELESKADKNTVYDDSEIKNQLTAIQQLIQQREAAYQKLIEDSKEALVQLKTGATVQPGQSVKIAKADVSFNLIKDSYIDRSGNSTTYQGWSETDYIDISDSVFVKIKGSGSSGYNAWYDRHLNFIRLFSYAGENILERPENAHFMRLSNASNLMSNLTVQKWEVVYENADISQPNANDLQEIEARLKVVEELLRLIPGLSSSSEPLPI